ncbi:MAG: hypothetical protein D6814_14530, partial [Calditrichaeota bacterium]
MKIQSLNLYMQHTWRCLALFALFYALIAAGCSNDAPSSDRRVAMPDTTGFTRHWEQAIPQQPVPDGIDGLSAQACGECHVDNYREWKQSIHADAWVDLQFQNEIRKPNSPYVCRNCHTPLQNQQEYIVTGLINGDVFRPVKKPNPDFDPELKQEAITCAVCHVRDGVIIGRRGNLDAPHPVKVDTVHLSEKLCFRCHNVAEVVTPTLVCAFETGNEWQEGPYSKLGTTCITCHMPKVYRPLVEDGPERWTVRHTFVGSGIPKFPGKPQNREFYVPGLDLQAEPTLPSFATGDTAYAIVRIRNSRAGHQLPTGDPERFITLTMQFLDRKGSVLKEHTERIGETWEWYPVARKIADNSIR